MDFKNVPRRAFIREVCPRDGFQNLKEFIPTEKKLEYIEAMIAAGVREVEASSFVSPKAVPQMADAPEVVREVARRHPEVEITALVPNVKGAEKALESGADLLNFVFSASESHNKANINRTVEESLTELSAIVSLMGRGVELSVSIATSFTCPFEGRVAPERVAELVSKVREKGVSSLCLAETIGSCGPRAFTETLRVVAPALDGCLTRLHIHDTYGLALLNVKAALDLGFDRFDSALGGLGGCPFAPGAAGNVATEDLVFCLEEMGVSTGLDPAVLTAAARKMRDDGLPTLGHLVKSSFGSQNV